MSVRKRDAILYHYRGDAFTDPALRGRLCSPLRRADGRCITGGPLATQLVAFDGRPVVVLRRQLRVVARTTV